LLYETGSFVQSAVIMNRIRPIYAEFRAKSVHEPAQMKVTAAEIANTSPTITALPYYYMTFPRKKQ
jgi:hypothetical protein